MPDALNNKAKNHPGVMMKVIKKYLILSVSFLLFTSIVSAADLSVEIGNLKSGDGNIRVGLFNAAADFPKKPLLGESVKAKLGAVTVVFKDLPPGVYAVSAFQDVNDNKKLDTNAVGKPNEPHGFSRNARRMFGPPSFDDAGFNLQEGAKTIQLDLQ